MTNNLHAFSQNRVVDWAVVDNFDMFASPRFEFNALLQLELSEHARSNRVANIGTLDGNACQLS